MWGAVFGAGTCGFKFLSLSTIQITVTKLEEKRQLPRSTGKQHSQQRDRASECIFNETFKKTSLTNLEKRKQILNQNFYLKKKSKHNKQAMAQAQFEKEVVSCAKNVQEVESVRGNDQGKKKMGGGCSSSIGGTSSGGCFKFNVHAAEFVPRAFTQIPVPGYYYPYSQYQDWIYVGDQDAFPFFDNKNVVLTQERKDNDLPEEVRLKIIKQVVFFKSLLKLCSYVKIVIYIYFAEYMIVQYGIVEFL